MGEYFEQFLHVSQFYETTTSGLVFLLIIMECLMLRYQIWELVMKEREQLFIQQYKVQKGSFSKEQSNIQNQSNMISQLQKEILSLQIKVLKKDSEIIHSIREIPIQNKQEGSPQFPPQNNKEHPENNQNTEEEHLTSLQRTIIGLYTNFHKFISESFPIIFSILTIGIIVKSTLVFSLGCFFLYILSTILIDLLALQQNLQEEYKKGILVSGLIQVFASISICGIFISYWIITQY